MFSSGINSIILKCPYLKLSSLAGAFLAGLLFAGFFFADVVFGVDLGFFSENKRTQNINIWNDEINNEIKEHLTHF